MYSSGLKRARPCGNRTAYFQKARTIAARSAPAVRHQPGRFTPRLLVYFAVVTMIWGSTWLVITSQLATVPASWSVAWRFLAGGIVMLLVCLFTGKSLRIDGRGHLFAIGIAVMQFALNFNLVYRAEQHITSGLVALSFALLIVPNTLLAAAFLGQAFTPRFAIGGLLGITGVGMMFARDLTLPGSDTAEIGLGITFAIGAVLAASVGNIMQATPAGRALPLEGGLTWSMLYGGLINAAIAWSVAGPPVIDLSPGYLAGLAYLAIVASALAFNLYYTLIREVGPGKAAYTGVIVPLIAMALSTVFESYVWTPLAMAGGVLALVGLVVALRSRG
jgi:drug/metabolite transporter (DMT)-like permease